MRDTELDLIPAPYTSGILYKAEKICYSSRRTGEGEQLLGKGINMRTILLERSYQESQQSRSYCESEYSRGYEQAKTYV